MDGLPAPTVYEAMASAPSLTEAGHFQFEVVQENVAPLPQVWLEPQAPPAEAAAKVVEGSLRPQNLAEHELPLYVKGLVKPLPQEVLEELYQNSELDTLDTFVSDSVKRLASLHSK